MAIIQDTSKAGPSLEDIKKEVLRRAGSRISPFEAVKKEECRARRRRAH